MTVVELKRVEPWPVAKVSCLVFAALGVIFGVVAVLNANAGLQPGLSINSGDALLLLFEYIISYIIFGVVAGFFIAVLYNYAAKNVGGVKMELGGKRP